ncbi:MAG TPA: hypothetical protein VN864_02225 [Thermoplasmata archaeon]|nr:hypothetical protein [Thermoplasmata archaeon]
MNGFSPRLVAPALALVLLLTVPLPLVSTAGAGPALASDHHVAVPAAPPLPSTREEARPSSGPSNPCDGPYPAYAGIGPFPAGCVGRDQAVAGFYSDLAGGAGNVSVLLTLPIDRSRTANQSDLYRAIWLGIVLNDPNAWMSQCFLEIRFQPDSSWTPPSSGAATSPNNWTGVVVGYELDPTTSLQEACFNQPLASAGVGGGQPLNFSGGDVLNISTVGWIGSVSGEQLTVVDTTSGATSQVRGIVDDGTPLDPAYSASNVPDALAGAATDIAPVSFGVELAGASNPSVPANSSFGGCTPGVPPASPADPSVPCPSYDPTAWANDTLAPMLLTPPVFSSSATTRATGELLVSSTIGGTSGLVTLSNASCSGRLGSAYCAYPWYSYSCGAAALEFGATDYSGVSADFGKQSEYATSPVHGLLGYPLYPSEGFAIPTCGGPTSNLTVGVSAGLGVVRFLSSLYLAPTATTVGPGEYGILAFPVPGEFFAGWTVTGSATVSNPNDAVTTVRAGAGGSVTATFTASPSLAQLGFTAVGNGSLVIGAGFPGSVAGLPTSVPSGGSVSLAPGIYPIQAAPSLGSSFTSWTPAGGVAVSAPAGPAVWLVVPVGGGTANLTATFSNATGNVTVVAKVVGNGTVVLNGTTLPFHPANATSYGSVTGAPGTYSATATPAPGWTFLGWMDAPGAVAVGSGNVTNASVAQGTAYLYGKFAAEVTVLTSPAALGDVSVNGSAPVGNGTVLPLPRGTYTIAAAPSPGAAFLHWTVSDPRSLYVIRPGFPFSKLVVNGTGTVTATFANSSAEVLTLKLAPANGGSLQFNFQNFTANVTVNSTVVNTTYELKGFPALGYKFLGFNTTGPVSFAGGQLSVTGSGGVVTAKFGIKLFPVTVVASRPGSVNLAVNGVTVASGTTLSLALGVYSLSATIVGSNTSFLGWSSGLPVANITTRGTATVLVNGAGSVLGIVALFELGGFGIAPPTVDVGSPAQFSVFANSTGALHYKFVGLPPGCASADRAVLTCTPTASGTFPVHASVTDSGGAVGTTPSSLLTVVGDPFVGAFTVTPSATDAGLAVRFLVTPMLGLGPYSFVYGSLPAGCVSTDVGNLTCTPTTAGVGVHRVLVTVTDSLGHLATANVTLTVNADPSVASVTATHPTTDVGVATTFTVTAAGGTGALSYQFSGLPTGCTSTNSSALRCVPTAAGSASVLATVTDGLGLSATGTLAVTINAAPSHALLTIAPASIVLGQSTVLSASAIGGTGSYSYDYDGLPTGCVSTNSSSFTCTPSVSGSYSVTVTVIDGLGANTTQTALLGVSAPPAPAPTPNGNPVAGVDWTIVAVVALVALVAAAVLVWRFGRPPEPAPAEPAGAEPTR